MTWRAITLQKYQRLEWIGRQAEYDELERTMFSVCELYNITEDELERRGAKKALRMAARVARVMNIPPKTRAPWMIGRYRINYNPDTLTFGQYAELMFFMQKPLEHAHYIMASISSSNARTHSRRSDYFLRRPVLQVVGALNRFIAAFAQFNDEYKALFGLDAEVHSETAFISRFNKQYGWIYSATSIAEHERIPLDHVYRLPVRQALNDLAFLKAKAKYEAEILKQHQHGR
jgi:hypothetical protein